MVTKHIKVYGIVQGVGFRPTVSRHAIKTGICGSVCNRGPYVEIFAGGNNEQVDEFLRLLKEEPPKRSAILKIDVKDIEEDDFKKSMCDNGLDNAINMDLKILTDKTDSQNINFRIIESKKTTGEIFISPDIAICDECREEMFDKKNRRYLHPFINCTSCGPRLTILDKLPYDRKRTSMKVFPMCKICNDEYVRPSSRRYDAQPVCCNDCGPTYSLLDMDNGEVIPNPKGDNLYAIKVVRDYLKAGKIAAIKGIGGFHIACDGTNEEAVMRLRELKHRPMKPFAVMMKDMDVVKRECVVTLEMEEILKGHQKPILILDKKNDGKGKLADSIAPLNPTVGVMLPYAPVQELLFNIGKEDEFPDVLVMTSGNVSGAPICHNDKEVINMLKGFVDVILTNNRDILIRTDDSVMDFLDNKPYMIRRSRGYAPIPYMLSNGFNGQVLSVGGELKNTFCIGKGNVFYPSSYVGDMGDYRTVLALEDGIKRMMDLLECDDIKCVVSDMHPLYNTVSFAEDLANKMNVPLIKVQHHYAHILACMAENDISKPVIGVSMDGTGFGDDESIWGGEILVCDYEGYERVSHIHPFFQMGGDSSSKEGFKIVISMLLEAESKNRLEKDVKNIIINDLKLCDEKDFKLLKMMYDRKINGVMSTSCGRLFDGISAMLGVRKISTFEGESAIALEHEALKGKTKACDINESKVMMDCFKDACIDKTDELFLDLAKERIKGTQSDVLAYDFHMILARMISNTVLGISHEKGINDVALSGGVFQNKLLTSMVSDYLKNEGLIVYKHSLIPPNDGGIALGQAVYGMNKICESKEK